MSAGAFVFVILAPRRDEAAGNKEPRRTVDVRRGLEVLLSLPPPGGNGLDCYNTIRSQKTDASVVSAAIKCQAEVAGTASSGHAAIWNFCCRPDRVCVSCDHSGVLPRLFITGEFIAIRIGNRFPLAHNDIEKILWHS